MYLPAPLNDFRPVEPGFDIANIEGYATNGRDLIHPELGSRILVIDGEPSGEESENIIARNLGVAALFPVIERTPDRTIYGVPRNAQPLVRIIEADPPIFSSDYVNLLRERAGALLGIVQKLDANGFGVDPEDMHRLAITDLSQEFNRDLRWGYSTYAFHMRLIPPFADPAATGGSRPYEES